MELTANHRVFSATRNGWVAAGDLQAGEVLQAQEGAVRVRSVRESARGLTSVFNLEVYARHEFFVGEERVRVHNGYGSVARSASELGRKLECFLGRATGNAHNVQRSTQMLSQLEKIGLPDNPATRQYLTEHLADVLNNPANIVRVEASGRVVRESLLMGPRGGLKFETIWEGNKLITGILFGGP